MSVMATRPPNMPSGAGAAKRPRLSLKINTPGTMGASASPASSRPASRPFSLNPSDPTAFNTLSNAYVTAIERTSTPTAISSHTPVEPLTAINTLQAISLSSPIRLQLQGAAAVVTPHTHTAPGSMAYPDTPVSAHTALSPSMMLPLPSVMSPTPPMSAGAVETGGSKVFSFSPRDSAIGKQSLEQALQAAAASACFSAAAPSSPAATPPQPRRTQHQRPVSRAGPSGVPPPYTHAKALRSILRNSPLPQKPAASPSTTTSLLSPNQQQRPTTRVRIQERAAKRVCYNSPIEQEITTNKYTKSHIDLLAEDASPCSPQQQQQQQQQIDATNAFTENEIRDGGQTPGPFEDSTRRLGAATDSLQVPAGGATPRNGRRFEKKRRWVWTIGREEDAEEDEDKLGGAVIAAARAAAAAAAGGDGASAVVAAPVAAAPPAPAPLATTESPVSVPVLTLPQQATQMKLDIKTPSPVAENVDVEMS